MKKILNIVLCVLVAISLFTLSVSADGVEAIPLGGTTEKADFIEDFFKNHTNKDRIQLFKNLTVGNYNKGIK
jgi:hypothetical protein